MLKKLLIPILALFCLSFGATSNATASCVEAKIEKTKSGNMIRLQAYAVNHLDEKVVIKYEFTIKRIDDQGNRIFSSTSGTVSLLPKERSRKLTSLRYNPPITKVELKLFRKGKLITQKTLIPNQTI